MNEPIDRTVRFRSGERNVFFHLLTACNLACRHCYINPDQHGASSVTREQIEAWLSLFIRPGQDTNVIFLGGEPTLHRDLPFGVRKAKEMGYRSVTVDTNGYLFHDFLAKVSPAELDFLSFSLDGPDPEVNDPIRGKGVYETCVANLQKAVSLGFNTSLIYTVSRLNIGSLARMPELLSRWGVKRFFIQVIGLRGKGADAPPGEGGAGLQVSPDAWLAVVPPVAAGAAELGLHVIYPKVFLGPDEMFECAGRVAENYFLFPNGRVYQCPLCEDYPLHSYEIVNNQLLRNNGRTEADFFVQDIAEGCPLNRHLQPANIPYDAEGRPLYKISCCLLKNYV